MLPLGLCRFKDRCYIKTARDHVQHQEKALKKIPLHSAPSRFFFVLFGGGGCFFTCPAASLLVSIGSVQVQ